MSILAFKGLLGKQIESYAHHPNNTGIHNDPLHTGGGLVLWALFIYVEAY